MHPPASPRGLRDRLTNRKKELALAPTGPVIGDLPLAGAGISFGSVKTAWEIVVDLARRMCQISDPAIAPTLDEDNVEEWFEREVNERLTYGGLLARVAPLPHERGAVLREYFEKEGPAGTVQLPAPTAAHRAVARLVAAGTVRVIVTMNFDHLFEAALGELGIEPIVISTESGAEGRGPLHTMKCCVVHLHGSYKDASSMLNTDTELGAYKLHMQELLSEIVRTHGLLITGWSAQWDQALRETVVREYRRRYTPAWVDHSPLKDHGRDTAAAIAANVIEATANQALTRLADAVDAMRTRQARNPLTASVVVDRIKRDLTGQRPAINAHDTFAAELGRLDDLQTLSDLLVGDDYDERLLQTEEACRVPSAATAVLARWGNDETDEWWLSALDQWSRAIDIGHYIAGRGKYFDLPLIVGTSLFYAAGIACVAGHRDNLLSRLVGLPAVASWDRSGSAHSLLAWDASHANTQRIKTNPLRDELAATLANALGVSHTRVDLLWQQFETLRTAARILTAPKVGEVMNEVIASQNSYYEARRQNDSSADQQQLASAFKEADKKLCDLARLSEPSHSRPHIHVVLPTSRDPLVTPRFVSEVAQRLAESEPHPALELIARPLDQPAAVRLALRAASMSFTLTADEMHRSLATKGMRDASSSDFWLDMPESE